MNRKSEYLLRKVAQHAADKDGMFDVLECGHMVPCRRFPHMYAAHGAAEPVSRRCVDCAKTKAGESR